MKKIGIYLLTIGTFLTGTSEMIVAGIVNVIAIDLDISITLVGQLVTAFSLAFAIGTPIVVTLTSSWERKKVLLGSLSVFLIGNLLSLLPLPFSFLLITRVILGASAGVFIVVSMSIAAKLVEPDKIGKAVSTVSLGFGAALVAGVPVGVIFSEWFGWRSIFALLAVLSFLIIFPLSRFIPSLEGEKSIPLKQQFSILKNRKIAGGLLIFFFLITGYGLTYTYLVPFLQETIRLTIPTISLSMLVFGLFSIVGTRFGGFGADKWGTSKTVTFSIIIHALLLSILPLFTSSILLTLIIAALWVGVANATIPALQTYFIQQTPQSSDLALSASNSVGQLGLAVGSGFGGLVIDMSNTAYSNPWFSTVILIFAFITAYIVLLTQKKIVTECHSN